MAREDCSGSVQLLNQHQMREPMRQRQTRQGQNPACLGSILVVETVSVTDTETKLGHPRLPTGLASLCELNGAEHLTALIHENRVAIHALPKLVHALVRTQLDGHEGSSSLAVLRNPCL